MDLSVGEISNGGLSDDMPGHVDVKEGCLVGEVTTGDRSPNHYGVCSSLELSIYRSNGKLIADDSNRSHEIENPEAGFMNQLPAGDSNHSPDVGRKNLSDKESSPGSIENGQMDRSNDFSVVDWSANQDTGGPGSLYADHCPVELFTSSVHSPQPDSYTIPTQAKPEECLSDTSVDHETEIFPVTLYAGQALDNSLGGMTTGLDTESPPGFLMPEEEPEDNLEEMTPRQQNCVYPVKVWMDQNYEYSIEDETPSGPATEECQTDLTVAEDAASFSVEFSTASDMNESLEIDEDEINVSSDNNEDTAIKSCQENSDYSDGEDFVPENIFTDDNAELEEEQNESSVDTDNLSGFIATSHVQGYRKQKVSNTDYLNKKQKDKTQGDITSTPSVEHLRQGKRAVEKNKDFSCTICSLKFNTMEQFLKHKVTVHSGERPFKCEVCGKGYVGAGVLQRHRRIHTGEKPFKCDICGKSFTEAGSLQRHIRTHTGEKPYKCDTCSRRFSEAGSLQRHLRTHTGEKPYRCEVCGKGFNSTSSLHLHSMIHTGAKPYTCDICYNVFSTRDHLERHGRKHTGERSFKCGMCGKDFSEAGTLQRHLRIHTGEKPFKCDICDKVFREAGNLQRHLRTHSGEKPFKCDICGKSFGEIGNLQRHGRTHTGEKPFKCCTCGKGFSYGGDLQRHNRTHTGEKPYSCKICGKGFSDAGNLQKHTKIHKRKMEISQNIE